MSGWELSHWNFRSGESDILPLLKEVGGPLYMLKKHCLATPFVYDIMKT